MAQSCTHKCTQVKADTQISHLQSKEESAYMEIIREAFAKETTLNPPPNG